MYRSGGHGGSGDVLVLIHGFPTASWDWQALWTDLCGRFALVLAPDLLGFGFSDKPRRYDYSIQDQADLLERLLEEMGVRRVHLLAHDYGDTVAQELLARDLAWRQSGGGALEILSCCLLNGGLFPETHRPRLVQRLLATPIGPLLARLITRRVFERSLASLFGPRTQPSAGELGAFWTLVVHNDGLSIAHRIIGYMAERRLRRERWVGALVDTPVPLRLIAGSVDPVSGAHMVARYRELLPRPDVVLLDEIGHYPQVEAPAGVLAAFLQFQARIG